METWEQVFAARPWGSWPDIEMVRAFKRLAPSAESNRPLKVLELGFGGASNLRFLLEEQACIAGIDIAPSALASAIERLSKWFPDWETRIVPSSSGDALVVGDVTELPWLSCTFDWVIDCGCVCCVDAEVAKTAYSEAYRVIRPGGHLFLRTFAPMTTGGRQAERGLTTYSSGPLAGIPPTRVSDLDELLIMTAGFRLVYKRLVTATDLTTTEAISEWILVFERPIHPNSPSH